MLGISINALTGDNGIINKASKAGVKTEKGKELEDLGIAVYGTLDETLRVDIDELKENILKQRPDAIIQGENFPIKVTLKYGTYTIDEFGKIEKLTGIALDKENLIMQIIDGEKEVKTLKATLTDIEGEITWSSSNPLVVTVDNTGKLTSEGAGTATITATCSGEIAECNVTVKSVISISSITLKIGTVEVTESTGIQEIDKGKTLQVVAITDNKSTEDVQWESSKPGIATIEASGDRNLIATIKGIISSDEEVTITAKGSNGVSKSIKVKVLEPMEYEAKDITSTLMTNDVIVDYDGREWNVIYADETNIYLIMKSKIVNPTDKTVTLNPPVTGSVKGNYSRGSAMLSDIATNEETAKRFPAVKSGWFYKWMESGYSSTNNNIKATLYMLDSNVWNIYKGPYGNWAIGGPTLEMCVKSYDKIKETNKETELAVISAVGYNDGGFTSKAALITKNMSLNNGQNYWLAGMDDYKENVRALKYSGGNGYFDGSYYYWTDFGFRPVVSLQSGVKLVKNRTTGRYTVEK